MTEYPLIVWIDDGNDVTKCWLSSDELILVDEIT